MYKAPDPLGRFAPKKATFGKMPTQYTNPKVGEQPANWGSTPTAIPYPTPTASNEPTAQQPIQPVYNQSQNQSAMSMPSVTGLPSLPRTAWTAPVTNTNVQSSITPGNVYDSSLTTAARNQGVAQSLAAGNPYSAQKAVTRPGFSRGAGTERLAAPIIAQGQANAAQAASMIPYSDQMTNMQFNLRGQQARDAESQGMAQLGNNMNSFDRSNTLNNQRSATSLLQALLGGF